MDIQSSHFTNTSAIRDSETALYEALWHACAGPWVNVPRAGERVFYFPQGHLEQVQAFTNQVIELPRPNLPSKILCRVINVQLKVDPETDEVFAQFTLLPEINQDENAAEMEPPLPPLPEFPVHSFCKTLTPSDTSVHGGFSVPKRYADQCFPPLDISTTHPTQELLARDLQGNLWRFLHIFRGQPRRHLLTSGWADFVRSKRLVPGDAFVFLRADNGELCVGVQRAMKPQGNNVPVSSANSLLGMYFGVLATAWEALSRRTLFTISFKPRTSPAEFIIPFDQYMRSTMNNYALGMRFQMKSNLETCLEQSSEFTGTIVGIEDADPINWPGSKWRCLKVRWDGNCNIPERVSHWKIELAAALAHPTLNLFPLPYPESTMVVPLSPNSSVHTGEGSSGVTFHPSIGSGFPRALRAEELSLTLGGIFAGIDESATVESFVPSSLPAQLADAFGRICI